VLDGLVPAPVRSDLPGGPVTTSLPSPVTGVLPEVHLTPDLPIDAEGENSATFEVIPAADNPEGDALTEVEQIVLSRIAGTGMAGSLSLRREARGLVVTIVTDQVLFAEARAEIQEAGLVVLDVIADAIADLPNDVIVEGHTDSRPLIGGRYADNWELSYARSAAVMRHLVDAKGFPVDRVALAAYADTHPLDPAGTPEAMAKNRRVEIVVLQDTD